MIDAINPGDGKPLKVQISYDRLQVVIRRSAGHARDAAVLVAYILQKPRAIFEGITREEDEDRRGIGWRCYCGIPPHSHRPDGTEAPPYRGQVYLVFVNADGIAYNWRWDKAEPDSPDLPINHGVRFKRRLL